MKKARRLVMLILLLSLFCLAFEAGAQGRKVRVCTPGAGTGSMHIYVAKERGYFSQENLDVDVLVTRGQICTMALINGQMELTTNPNVFDAMVAGKIPGQSDLCHCQNSRPSLHRRSRYQELQRPQAEDHRRQHFRRADGYAHPRDSRTARDQTAQGCRFAANRHTGSSLCILESRHGQSGASFVNPRLDRPSGTAFASYATSNRRGFRRPLWRATNCWPGSRPMLRSVCARDRPRVIFITATMPRRRSLSFRRCSESTTKRWRSKSTTMICSATIPAADWRKPPCGKSWSALAKC